MKVSVITPSSRPEMLPRLIETFKSQDYPDKELNIISDGVGHTFHTQPGDEVYHWGQDNMSIGAKRNYACAYARGEIILHMDDDDYYAPNWISESVSHLLSSGATITGLITSYFYQLSPAKLYLYQYTGRQPYVIEASMCYLKSEWERNRFPDISNGEGSYFCANIRGMILPHYNFKGFCAILHGANTASHKAVSAMKEKPLEALKITFPHEFLERYCK